jgi:hypothetical protein
MKREAGPKPHRTWWYILKALVLFQEKEEMMKRFKPSGAIRLAFLTDSVAAVQRKGWEEGLVAVQSAWVAILGVRWEVVMAGQDAGLSWRAVAQPWRAA